MSVAEFDDLRAENQALRARVATLEADLDSRPRVERSPMFALLDALPMLVGAISGDGTCEFISLAFNPWIAGSRDQAINVPFLPNLIPSLREVADGLFTEAQASGLGRRELSLPNRDGAICDLQINVIARRLSGASNGFIWVAQDVTHHRLADQALRSSEQRLRLAVEAAGLGVWDRDMSNDAIVYSTQGRAIYGLPLEGPVTLEMVRGATHPEDLPLVRAAALRTLDPALKEEVPCEYRVVRPNGEIRWILAHGGAIFETRDGVEVATRYVGMLQDVTDATLAARRQQFLMHELNHRVKNTLASVQSISRLTLRGARDVAESRDRLADRLVALAGAHDILTRENWEAAEITEVVRTAISPYDLAGASRFRLDGPGVRIAPKVAVSLALALHELVTNAVKYGALSADGGIVDVAWSVDGAELTLDWRERGGPPVVVPTRTGFGTRLLTQGLAIEFGGKARLSYDPQGLTCRIVAPLVHHGVLDLG